MCQKAERHQACDCSHEAKTAYPVIFRTKIHIGAQKTMINCMSLHCMIRLVSHWFLAFGINIKKPVRLSPLSSWHTAKTNQIPRYFIASECALWKPLSFQETTVTNILVSKLPFTHFIYYLRTTKISHKISVRSYLWTRAKRNINVDIEETDLI